MKQQVVSVTEFYPGLLHQRYGGMVKSDLLPGMAGQGKICPGSGDIVSPNIMRNASMSFKPIWSHAKVWLRSPPSVYSMCKESTPKQSL